MIRASDMHKRLAIRADRLFVKHCRRRVLRACLRKLATFHFGHPLHYFQHSFLGTFTMSIRVKLIGAFIAVALIGLLIGGVGFVSLHKLQEKQDISCKYGTKSIVALLDYTNAFIGIKLIIREILLHNDPEYPKTAQKDFANEVVKLNASLESHKDTITETEDKANLDTLEKATSSYLSFATQVVKLGAAGQIKEAKEVLFSP